MRQACALRPTPTPHPLHPHSWAAKAANELKMPIIVTEQYCITITAYMINIWESSNLIRKPRSGTRRAWAAPSASLRRRPRRLGSSPRPNSPCSPMRYACHKSPGFSRDSGRDSLALTPTLGQGVHERFPIEERHRCIRNVRDWVRS